MRQVAKNASRQDWWMPSIRRTARDFGVLNHELAARTGIALTALLFLTLFSGIGIAQDGYDSYYLYLGNYPNYVSPGYHEDVQGITHDENHWFITQSDADDPDPAERSVWKIPVEHDLAKVTPGVNGVERMLLRNIHDADFVKEGYEHFGDPSHYKFDGQGYLIIPMEFGCHAIAIFTADDLAFKGYFKICQWQANASWCAVDPNGYLYSSDYENVWRINRYEVNWPEFRNGDPLKLTRLPGMAVLDETGLQLILSGVQGGDITRSGQLLYVVADGIHVFDMQTGQRVAHSTNGYGYFNYHFVPTGWPGEMEEPEGITIWDLDDGRAPRIAGQLHVILLDNDAPSADEFCLKHYSGIIFVDGAYAGNEYGSFPQPFKTISKAYNHYPIWDGAQMKIRAGSYPESLILSKRIRLIAEGGTVLIGN